MIGQVFQNLLIKYKKNIVENVSDFYNKINKYRIFIMQSPMVKSRIRGIFHLLFKNYSDK